MLRTTIVSAALAFAMIGPSHAQDAPLSTDGVVEFFQNEVTNLGKTRGICIGTAEECAAPEPKGLDMLVTFELDSADLTDDARENLAVFADALANTALANISFVVEGHTDARGSDDYNSDLSQARAAAVAEYLTALGVSSERLTAIGLGESAPRTGDGLDPENRRVELRIKTE